MTGNIFNIQRFSVNDGPGIRTTVFLKGCPLSCAWCHNPESKSACPEIFFDLQKCTGCRLCETVCKNNQHIFDAGKHAFLRNNCSMCMECITNCPAQAFEVCGKKLSVDDVIEEVLRDRDFYAQSGGGITLSGGEPLMQYNFSLELLKRAKEQGIHIAVETCGFYSKNLDKLSRYVDLWLYDIKLITENEHIKYTGASNKTILKNLHFLDSIGAEIILRCPIIPDVNCTQKHFAQLAELADKHKNISAIQLEPYHPLGIEKSQKLGKICQYNNKNFLSAEELNPFVDYLKSKTNKFIEIS